MVPIVDKCICEKCKFSTYIPYMKEIACDYITAHDGKSRTFIDGKQRKDLRSDRCDEFEPLIGKRLTGHQKIRDIELKRRVNEDV